MTSLIIILIDAAVIAVLLWYIFKQSKKYPSTNDSSDDETDITQFPVDASYNPDVIEEITEQEIEKNETGIES